MENWLIATSKSFGPGRDGGVERHAHPLDRRVVVAEALGDRVGDRGLVALAVGRVVLDHPRLEGGLGRGEGEHALGQGLQRGRVAALDGAAGRAAGRLLGRARSPRPWPRRSRRRWPRRWRARWRAAPAAGSSVPPPQAARASTSVPTAGRGRRERLTGGSSGQGRGAAAPVAPSGSHARRSGRSCTGPVPRSVSVVRRRGGAPRRGCRVRQLLPGLLVLAFTLYCFLDVLLRDSADTRGLPKVSWALIVLFFPVVGRRRLARRVLRRPSAAPPGQHLARRAAASPRTSGPSVRTTTRAGAPVPPARPRAAPPEVWSGTARSCGVDDDASTEVRTRWRTTAPWGTCRASGTRSTGTRTAGSTTRS